MVDDESPVGPVPEQAAGPERHELLRQRYPTTHRYRGPFPKGYFKRKPSKPPPTPEEKTIKRQLKKRGLPESWAGRLASLGLKPRGHSFQTLLRKLEGLVERIEQLKREIQETRDKITEELKRGKSTLHPNAPALRPLRETVGGVQEEEPEPLLQPLSTIPTHPPDCEGSRNQDPGDS